MSKRHFLSYFVWVFFYIQLGAAQSITEAQLQKLHPNFHALVAPLAPQLKVTHSGVVPEPSTKAADGSDLYGAIVYTSNPEAVRMAGIHVNSDFKTFVTAQLRPEDMIRLARIEQVKFLDPGSVNYPHLDLSIPEVGVNLLHAGFLNDTQYKGKDVIVVVYDTGIDWTHHDFRVPGDTTKTRILFIWDQTITADLAKGESPPVGFSYGVEYTAQHIEDELDGTPAGFVRERDINGHGTHVAGIAVGNGLSLNKKYMGVAPEADIIVIKGGDGSFSETKMIDGLTYARNKAQLRGKPVVLNWSIGGHQGPHDGSRAYELAVNDFVSAAGRVVVISAGNDGDKDIHFNGSISAGVSETLTITVPSYTPNSGTNNDRFTLDIWFDGNPSVRATVTSPSGISVTRDQGQTGVHSDNTDGTIDFWNYQSNLNNARNIYLNVRDADATKPPKSGSWTLTITSLSGSTQYDGWLVERIVSNNQPTTISNGNTSKTVAMPGTARDAITVGSYVTRWSWPTASSTVVQYSGTERTTNISTFSSIGPTRDGRMKPELAAPGQGIGASLSSSISRSASFVLPGSKHHINQGTSMAAPHVTGAVAVLLGKFPTLTATQVKSLLTSTATVDAMTGSVPNYTWGYGKMNILNAMLKAINPSASAERTTLSYDRQTGNHQNFTLNSSNKFAVRFTPTRTGRLTGVLLQLRRYADNAISGTGPLTCEVFTNASGSPGIKLGSTVTYPFSLLSAGILNYIDMLPANVDVTVGTDYHIVLSVGGQSDALVIAGDDGLGSTGRSSVFNGSAWLRFDDPNSGFTGFAATANLRVRTVVTNVSGLVSVQETTGGPLAYELSQSYPNPFNPITTIEFRLPARELVSLRVYDLLGREVALLLHEEVLPGSYTVRWDASHLPTGVYYYRLTAGSFTETKKAILLK